MIEEFSLKCLDCSSEWIEEEGDLESYGFPEEDLKVGDQLIMKCPKCNQYECEVLIIKTVQPSDVLAEINQLVLEAENDPNLSEEEKEAVREFASDVSKVMIELAEFDNLLKNGDNQSSASKDKPTT